jgi:transposase
MNADQEARQQRGLVIAATQTIQQESYGWLVPSQSDQRKGSEYCVTRQDDGLHCSCPDFELRHQTCKHGFAVEFYLKRETITSPDGETTVTETRAVRVTYPQNWPAYNAAQTAEKELFCHLLRDLCAAVPEPEHVNGRPPVPISDALFAATYKVYSGVSSRRFMTDLRDAEAKGFVTRPWHFNTVLKVIETPTLAPVLQRLVTTSAAPLRAVETAFAVDSTGFGTQQFYRHYSAKYGKERVRREFIKLHALVGTKTNVVAAAVVTDQLGSESSDSRQFIPLLEAGAETFKITEVSADKAYLSRANLDAATALGATPFIPLKANTLDNPKSPAWSKLFHLYSYRIDEFLPYYHKRSNVESTFSAMKRLLGDTLRSKGIEAQTNELLMKVVAYNITCTIHSIFELGVTVPGLSACTQTALAAHEVGR